MALCLSAGLVDEILPRSRLHGRSINLGELQMLSVGVSGIVARSTFAGVGTKDIDLNAYLQRDGRRVSKNILRW